MKRAALYARVSTAQQEEQGTIASQVVALRERITQDGYHLDPRHEFIDDGISGAYLARPSLDRLRDLASERAFDVLYVLSPDRLARRYAHQCVVLEELAFRKRRSPVSEHLESLFQTCYSGHPFGESHTKQQP